MKKWKIALPLHPEFRTLPMLFYVPPLLPVTGSMNDDGLYESSPDFFSSLENARLPMRYMASLFSAGDEDQIIAVYKKLIAGRLYKRAETVGDVSQERLHKCSADACTTPAELEEIYQMTSLAGFDERFVIPPFSREVAIDLVQNFAGSPGRWRDGLLARAAQRSLSHVLTSCHLISYPGQTCWRSWMLAPRACAGSPGSGRPARTLPGCRQRVGARRAGGSLYPNV